MAKLDHLAVNVGGLASARDWYVSVLGLEVEFEGDGPPAVAGLKDEGDFTLILVEQLPVTTGCSLYFQVDDVERAHADLSRRGVPFQYGPQANDWGYGAALTDPDGRTVGLWDAASMSAHGHG